MIAYLLLPASIVALTVIYFLMKKEQVLEIKVDRETKNWADAKAFSKN